MILVACCRSQLRAHRLGCLQEEAAVCFGGGLSIFNDAKLVRKTTQDTVLDKEVK